jgi:hypothetical protein
MVDLRIRILLLALIVLGLSAPASAQLMSVSGVETLLSGGVAQTRIEALIKERGIDFELTDDLKERFRKMGAGPGVIRSLELASVVSRIKRDAEKTGADALAKEQAKADQRRAPMTKADPSADKQAPTESEAGKKSAPTNGTEKTFPGGKADTSHQQAQKLPDQLKETADQVLTLDKIAIRDGEVSGELVNRSPQGVYGVELQVLYSWRWNNDFHPGRDDPGRAEYFKIEREISPGQRVPFVHKPSPPLPVRKDGTFDISIKVISFSKIFRAS